ncbi:DoxX family membrane protein [candidate division KSB1 bacterium]|nr:DoxX family membrane protein [candidate division KSB1 bacterium]RQW02669.1 MAG: DoxX family membrane protein [candidate division KSB1 bacterium]
MNRTLLIVILRIFLGVVFILAGASKIGNPAAFAEDIDNYRMLPYALVTFLAIVLPWIEICAGILLVFGKFLHGAAFTVLVLNMVFIIAISSALARGLSIDCGCFSPGTGAAKVGVLRLIEDFIFLAIAVYIFRTAHHKAKPSKADF